MIVRPKLNVIIPLYNAEKYIEKCLLSIVNQTYENINVIVIDDGSTDRSVDIVEKIAKRNEKVQLLRQANSGVSKARNMGLSIVKSGKTLPNIIESKSNFNFSFTFFAIYI